MRLSFDLEIRRPKTKTLLIAVGVILLVVVVLGVLKLTSSYNPIPQSIRHQLSFKTVYPTGSQAKIDPTSYKYQSQNRQLSYNVNNNGDNVVVSEQPAPGNASDHTIVYYQSLGLHPVAQIDTNLGLAVIVNFYSSSGYSEIGQDAILNYNGTLFIAQPAKNMSNEAWKRFLNNLSSS